MTAGPVASIKNLIEDNNITNIAFNNTAVDTGAETLIVAALISKLSLQ